VQLKKHAIVVAALIMFMCLSACVASRAAKAETRAFTDSAGREVQIPVEITTIAPSGSYAQLILYTLCPDKLIGLSDPFTRIQKKYIDEKYYDLPIFGKLYGSAGTFNLEEIIKASPDVIIDMGERKTGIGADMDSVQSRTGIPVIFIEATIDTMADAYDMLGDMLGMEGQAAELSRYIREVMDFAADTKNKIQEGTRPSVLYSQGEYGNEVNGAGSVHSEVLDYVGVKNAAVMDSILATGGDEVSMEQIILWNPEVVILAPDSCYREIYTDSLWAEVDAVRNRRVYEAPIGPYNWLDRPPSVQRVLGILWLGNLVYPEYYDFDMTEKAQEFYKLFFRYALSTEEAQELMARSR
jgi:iron complex transport system substrate-binding protein